MTTLLAKGGRISSSPNSRIKGAIQGKEWLDRIKNLRWGEVLGKKWVTWQKG